MGGLGASPMRRTQFALGAVINLGFGVELFQQAEAGGVFGPRATSPAGRSGRRNGWRRRARLHAGGNVSPG